MTFSSHKRHGNKPDLNNVFVFEVALQRAFAAHQVVITHGFLPQATLVSTSMTFSPAITINVAFSH